MRISIITVCLNCETLIGRTLDSVLMQDYPDIEYVVIDGGSTDKTLLEIEKRADRIAFICSQHDNGLYDAMNKGVGVATGNLIWFLNAGDRFFSNSSVQTVVKTCKQFPDCDMIFGAVDIVSENNPSQLVRRYKSVGFRPWMLRFGIMPPHPGIIMKRQTFLELGGFDLQYQIVADFDLVLRGLLKNLKSFHGLGERLIYMLDGGVSNRGWSSKKQISREVMECLTENNVTSHASLLYLRFPLKWLLQVPMSSKFFKRV